MESEEDEENDEDEDKVQAEENAEDGKKGKSKMRAGSNNIPSKKHNTTNGSSDDSDESTITNTSDNDRNKNVSVLNQSAKTALQFYVRVTLFAKIKIIGNEHLEFNGKIIKEALMKAGFDSKNDNLNAFVNSCRRLIKRTISSKRSYLKREICDVFIGKSLSSTHFV